MIGWQDRTLADLLAEHGLAEVDERPFPTDGWSGATFTQLVRPRDAERFVLKRTSLATDWIARATSDTELREAWLAARPTRDLAWMPGLTLPYLGAAADGDGVAILTPDLSSELIAWERPGHDPVIDRATLERVVRAIARLHALPWSETLGSWVEPGAGAPPWCPLDARLRLLSPRSAAAFAAEGNPVGDRFLEGWAAFRRLAPSAAVDLVDRLDADLRPLLAALAELPDRGLHGDLKLANVALLTDERVGFIDWQMTMRAPVAVELGWLLVSNSASLPVDPETFLGDYRDALAWDVDRWGAEGIRPGLDGLLGDWERQCDLVWIVGLFLRGWRKGLDAQAGATLASGVSAADDLARWCAAAVDAAERRF